MLVRSRWAGVTLVETGVFVGESSNEVLIAKISRRLMQVK